MIRYSIASGVTALTFTRDDKEAITSDGYLSLDTNIRAVECHQTHSANVRLISPELFSLAQESQEKILDDVDALITDTHNICLTVRTADCTPILLYDPTHQAIAAIHSGWKGTLQNIVRATFLEMTAAFRTSPSEVLVVIGPSIAQSNYQVGEELLYLFSSANPQWEVFFTPDLSSPNHFLLDVKGIVFQQLKDLGVKTESIFVSDLDTYTNPLLFSARRDGSSTGRLVSAIYLNLPNN